ncbi:MAG: N-acetyltransferase [Myxococcota bacterium]|nr:N-acetyltransferase [Myxococcota bacterium]
MLRRDRLGAPPRVHPPSVVAEGAHLGTDVVVGAFCFVAAGAVVGRGTRIQSHTSIWDGVTLGEDVFVGPGAVFTNVRHPRAAFSRAPRWDRTVVDDGATLGAAAVLVAPVRVGRCAMVGAGAVVIEDVQAHAIVAGNPARVIGWACECGQTVGRGAERAGPLGCTGCGRVVP